MLAAARRPRSSLIRQLFQSIYQFIQRQLYLQVFSLHLSFTLQKRKILSCRSSSLHQDHPAATCVCVCLCMIGEDPLLFSHKVKSAVNYKKTLVWYL